MSLCLCLNGSAKTSKSATFKPWNVVYQSAVRAAQSPVLGMVGSALARQFCHSRPVTILQCVIRQPGVLLLKMRQVTGNEGAQQKACELLEKDQVKVLGLFQYLWCTRRGLPVITHEQSRHLRRQVLLIQQRHQITINRLLVDGQLRRPTHSPAPSFLRPFFEPRLRFFLRLLRLFSSFSFSLSLSLSEEDEDPSSDSSTSSGMPS